MSPSPEVDSSEGAKGWMRTCRLDDVAECGMESELAEDGSKVTFNFDLRLVAKSIKIKNMVIKTQEFLGGVTFSCEYPAIVDVSSQFQSHVMDTTMTSTGNLANGFDMTFGYNGKNIGKAVKLGQDMNVDITWSINLQSSIHNIMF